MACPCRRGSQGGPGQINAGSQVDESSAGPRDRTLASGLGDESPTAARDRVLSASMPLGSLKRNSIKPGAFCIPQKPASKLLLLSSFHR